MGRERRVLILDNSVWPDVYRPTDHFRPFLGPTPTDSVHVSFGETIPDLRPYTHLIVTGSEASITQREPWYDAEVRAIREATERGLAVLGSCFGHQMLVYALSGEAFTTASPTPEVGWIEVDLTAEDKLFTGLPDPFHVFAAHYDEVRDVPAPWRILARSGRCAVQAARYGERPVWGLQAHPEIDPTDARALLEGELLRFPEKGRFIRQALLETPKDDRVAKLVLERFLASG